MPPKAPKSAAKPSTSRDIISTGPKEVVASKRTGGTTVRPTTTKALVLRNGKYGARGTGEVAVTTKMTGSEKLDLLAEDLVEKAQSALRAPFRLEDCLEIAISQFKEFIDDVRSLKDCDLFYGMIEEELKARAPQTKNAPDPTRNPTYLASVISNRIHNAYMVASAWKLVADTLCELEEDGLDDSRVVKQLTDKPEIRGRYLILYDMINNLVDIHQTKFAVLATTTPHYAPYFKEIVNQDGTKGASFDWPRAREVCRSFLDCIIIELCFPRGTYPKAVLYDILRQAVEEAPREARRFPQSLWDAVGDLAVCVQLQQLIETPLLHPDAKAWKDEERKMPPEYDQWIDAQLFSENASDLYENYKDAIYPLERTKKAEVLANMWKLVNANYITASGKEIDSLWALQQAIKPIPRWHPYKPPVDDLSDSEDEGGPAQGKKPKKKVLAITADIESDDSMPPLQDVSDTEESEDDLDDSDDSDSDEEDSDAESGYNTDEEDELRELYKEAMDTLHATDWNNPEDKLEPDTTKGNPFLKLLGSLRGRMFQSSTKLKTATGTVQPPPTKKQKKKAAQAAKAQAAAEGKAVPGGLQTTIEEVDDEDEAATTSKKKKKKKPKKKKRATTGGDAGDDDADDEPDAPAEAPASPPAKQEAAKAKAATSPKAAAKSPVVPGPNASTTSFMPPLEQVTTAQSARSYLKSENLDAQKAKVKSRPDHASMFAKQKGVLGKLASQAEEQTPHEKKEKRTFFASLRKKTRGYMHQILHTAEDDTKGSAGMKWDTFVKVMEHVGFEVNPSTAGSSVRFTPKNSRDNPISFHKPHPDSTIPPKMLKQFSKRLRDHYGWVPEDLE
ncbi:hypothetical protein AAF712_004111 [Marasmius tenuissimus]|uniref:Uncharacterized protein n=1 Tax=Marasmius tenuissimus TaxID=585030 RepID=A0ABR3A5V1_9AGAR